MENRYLEFWGEKSPQILPREDLTVFGIKISTRYSKVYELIELLNFSTELANKNVHKYVSEVFYDTQACLCNITMDVNTPYLHKKIIKECAQATLSQYEFEGGIYHKDEE